MAYIPADIVEVRAWGRTVGALAAGGTRGAYDFQYDPDWVRAGREVSPILMPLSDGATRVYAFPGLNSETYAGLPPMIADSLPDAFGNSVTNAWLAREGVSSAQITALDRLAYLGARGMGALEYVPDRSPRLPRPTGLDLSELILAARAAIHGSFSTDAAAAAALAQIIQVGTSAGGARAKAVINYNPTTGEVASGHAAPTAGLEPWLLKFDGMGTDQQLGEGGHYGEVEYAYARMAAAAGISMSETQLLREHGRAHFMTRRFDRIVDDAGRVRRMHMQTLCGLAAVDFNARGSNDYAQYLQAIVDLGLGAEALTQGFARMVFNVLARNCDDHSKNFAFLMDESGTWSLAPAYDITFAYSPESIWVNQHLMGVGGKFDDITTRDLMDMADRFEIAGARAALHQVQRAVARWPEFASEAQLPEPLVRSIGTQLGGQSGKA